MGQPVVSTERHLLCERVTNVSSFHFSDQDLFGCVGTLTRRYQGIRQFFDIQLIFPVFPNGIQGFLIRIAFYTCNVNFRPFNVGLFNIPAFLFS
jgi:hypothetical protein